MAIRFTTAAALALGAFVMGGGLATPVAAQQNGPTTTGGAQSGLQSADLYKLRSVGDVQLSPDGKTIAYSIQSSERPGRPSSQVWLMDVASGESRRLGSDREGASGPRWSPDGKRIAFFGHGSDEEGSGLMIANADGSNAVFIAKVTGTNHPLPSSGDRIAWAPDGGQIAFVSAAPGPEADANGDPMVITRYLYKPTASEGMTRFNDNRRIHIFVADVASKAVTQITDGVYYEHSLDWSPKGDEIAFISNRGPDPDRFFNYDIFAVKVADKSVRRITDTKSAEYRPAWAPDGKTIAYLGTKRPLTSSETTMEDTHVWVRDADGKNPREVGASIDNRQASPSWAQDGGSLYFTVQHRGSTALYRIPVAGPGAGAGAARAETVITAPGSLGSWSIGANGKLAFAFSTPGGPAELYTRDTAVPAEGAGALGTKRTTLNDDLLRGRALGDTEELTFKSFDGTQIGAWLTKPVGLTAGAGTKAPLIVMIHGGPHGAQGPAFNSKAQVYAGLGWASLMVNYRGSTGYGQKLADAIFKDQNGGEAKDVLAGVDAALAKYPWLDGTRLGVEGGSYGGQLTNWLITQTDRFKAAVPAAGIANLVSFNYMSYYHDYLAVEFGAFPHQNGLMDLLWERSPIRYVQKVKTPTMFVHGENDNDVPIAEAEQFYIAIRDVGVESIFVRYPREGHGVRETKHVIDVIDRSAAWYRKHFGEAAAPTAASRD
jgi:dipeptidyl aminopeptidase/acylaminoacyl peptidase